MDGFNLEHSDSDSGESWTLLDQSSSYTEDAPEYPCTLPETYSYDKDEDTDGISIISDSDHEHMSVSDNNETGQLSHSAKNKDIFNETEQSNLTKRSRYQEPFVSVDDVVNDSNGKVKTYVHRRNKRLGTVLNIIMLGSVITAAGVAIGHMWGAKNDCSLHNSASVNKILSNLYKLQEENSILRNKIRELATINKIHTHQKTPEDQKVKKNRCKKVFEDTLNNRDTKMFVKCVDNLTPHLSAQVTPEFEKEFLNDLGHLQSVYRKNRSWLDAEIKSRMTHEQKVGISTKIISKTKKNELEIKRSSDDVEEKPPQFHEVKIEIAPEIKIDQSKYLAPKSGLSNTNINFVNVKEQKKINKKDIDIVWPESSETEFVKDDRYNKHKHKHEKKKHDRQKSYKKQKRRNKYEQWEMKGGYLRDYDDISIPSLLENEYIMKNSDKNSATRDFEKNNYLSQFSEERDVQKETEKKQIKSENNIKEMNWFEKRATSRKQARKKLEKELFGEASPNTSMWYFRRMHRREQCRVKGNNNSIHKKCLKRNMNFKMKH